MIHETSVVKKVHFSSTSMALHKSWRLQMFSTLVSICSFSGADCIFFVPYQFLLPAHWAAATALVSCPANIILFRFFFLSANQEYSSFLLREKSGLLFYSCMHIRLGNWDSLEHDSKFIFNIIGVAIKQVAVKQKISKKPTFEITQTPRI